MKIKTFRRNLSVAFIILLGIISIVLFSIFIKTRKSGFLVENSEFITVALNSVITCSVCFYVLTLNAELKIINKFFITLIIVLFFVSFVLYVLDKYRLLNKFSSVEEFRKHIESFGKYAAIYYIIIQFLQVVVLPIPSLITVAAGVLMFGAFYGAIYSCVGIIFGSLVAYFIGRSLGNKAVKWLVGEQNLNKGLKFVEGKGKLLFSLMFLFPCFPDDLLCFIAGITKMNAKFFILAILLTRTVSIFTAAYSLNNRLIPYNTWWGILLWVLFFTFSAVVVLHVYKRAKNKNKIK